MEAAISKQRIDELVDLILTLPKCWNYIYEEGDSWVVSSEWLCGETAGRVFTSGSVNSSLGQLINYLDEHKYHKSVVGRQVSSTGWPDLRAVNRYLASEGRC